MELFKKCAMCGLDKSFNEFKFHPKTKDKKASYCNQCCKAYNDNHYKNNKNKYIHNANHWRSLNLEKSKEYRKKYRKEYGQRPISKIRRNLRKRIKELLSIKVETPSKMIGCTNGELKKYFESKFRDGMTWDNYGSVWHIDYIRPLSSFDLSNKEEIKLANHFTNLQPLLAKENLRKGASWQ